MTKYNAKAYNPRTIVATLVFGFFAAWGFKSLFSNTQHPTSDAERASTTVMITNMARNSGGTGVVLKSSHSESYILTNNHVCQLAKNGAIVSNEQKSAPVVSWQSSQIHDLCLIRVLSSFGVSTEVSSSPPKPFTQSFISGHPNLNPTTATYGHFGNKLIVQVLTGFRPCTKEDQEGENALFCFFLGGIPVIRTYEAQYSSALIMPGSSGSAVFNESGYISGLVFAGSGQGIGFSLLVPGEYVYNFVTNELPTLENNFPDMTNQTQEASNDKHSRSLLKQYCKNKETEIQYMEMNTLCNTIYNF